MKLLELTLATAAENLALDRERLPIGEALRFDFDLCVEGESPSKVRLELGVYYRKARGNLVPDDVVQMCTAAGSPEEVKAKVREYVDHGATCPILYPLGDPRLMIDIFSDGYSN